MTQLVDFQNYSQKEFLIDYKDEDDLEIDPKFKEDFPDMEINYEKSKEAHDRKINWHVPLRVKKQVQKYNRWVDEVRFKSVQWRPKKPIANRKTPFSQGDIYLNLSDKNIQKYPEIKKVYEENDKEPELDEFMMPAYYKYNKK